MVGTPNQELVQKGRTMSIDQAVQRGGVWERGVRRRRAAHDVGGQCGLHLDDGGRCGRGGGGEGAQGETGEEAQQIVAVGGGCEV